MKNLSFQPCAAVVSSCDLLNKFQMDPFEPEHTTEWYIKNLSDEQS